MEPSLPLDPSPPPHATSAAAPPTPPASKPSLGGKLLSVLNFSAALAAACGLLAWLLFAQGSADPGRETRKRNDELVQVVAPGVLAIPANSDLSKNLTPLVVTPTKISTPQMVVTGRIAASVRPGVAGETIGPGRLSDHWQFDTPELLGTFTDWQKAVSDIAFCKKQMTSIADLAKSRIDAQKIVVARLTKTVADGADAVKDLDAETANLLQFEIQGRKDVHEAETAVRMAERTESLMARQLQQAGLEPQYLEPKSTPVVLVIADIPEALVCRVVAGQSCRAKILGQDGATFDGKVGRVSPTLSKERRTLRALFALDDPQGRLLPGMYIEVGLGTDSREGLQLPRDAVLRIGRSAYVLTATENAAWKIREVQVGESCAGDCVEVLGGIKGGDRVIASGADLLKPQATAAIRSMSATATEPISQAKRNVAEPARD
jgi:hypothetical protein